MKTISYRWAILLMAAAFVARGSSFMFSKHLLNTIEPFNLLAIRSLIAFAALMMIFGKRVTGAIRDDLAYLKAGALIGLLFFAVMVLELNGIRYTTTSNASLIENSAIVLVLAGLILNSLADSSIKSKKDSKGHAVNL